MYHFLHLKYCFTERNNSSTQDCMIMFSRSILKILVIFIIFISVSKERLLFVSILQNKDTHGTKIDSPQDIQINFSSGYQLRNYLYLRRICILTTEINIFCLFSPESVISFFNLKSKIICMLIAHVSDTHAHTVCFASLLAGNCLHVVHIHRSQSAFYKTVVIISILLLGKCRNET